MRREKVRSKHEADIFRTLNQKVGNVSEALQAKYSSLKNPQQKSEKLGHKLLTILYKEQASKTLRKKNSSIYNFQRNKTNM